MKGLLTKEFLSLRYQLKSYTFTLVMFVVIGMVSKNIMYITMIMSVTSLNQTFTSFNYDHASNWDQFALAMPTKRKDLVMSKYIYSTVLLVVSLVLSILISYFGIYLRSNIGISDVLFANYSVFFVMLVMNVINLPVTFKFGIEKARVSVFGIFLVLAAIIVGLVFILPTEATIAFLYKNEILLLGLSPLLLIALLVISFNISLRIYKKKDF